MEDTEPIEQFGGAIRRTPSSLNPAPSLNVETGDDVFSPQGLELSIIS
jgi:hypothetical protein